IVRSATTMGSLIDDMLTYTSTTLGQGLSLNLTRADFAGIAAEVVHEIELNHPDREFRLVLRGDLAGEWDANRVRQGLSNLVTNAARHAPQDSAITVTVDGEGTEGDVVAAIHNMGDPIPEQELRVIFQPFRRASTGGDNPAGVGGGTGLGLHIARSMAEAHGGTVTVESSAEAGTTFFMRLPRSAPAA
ncbi:MAG: sensor histidine kinase, partial [Gemmatimonadota bacterium]